MIKKKAKRNPQDATLRNIRALKKRVEAVELKIPDMENRIAKSDANATLVMNDYMALRRLLSKFLNDSIKGSLS